MTKVKSTNQPDRYDPARVARTRPIEAMVEQLHLPLNRHRKVLSILSALQIQIEDGGDSAAVNDHLLAALREAVLHQVSPDQAAAVLAAVDTFAKQEQLRWHQIAVKTSR